MVRLNCSCVSTPCSNLRANRKGEVRRVLAPCSDSREKARGCVESQRRPIGGTSRHVSWLKGQSAFSACTMAEEAGHPESEPQELNVRQPPCSSAEVKCSGRGFRPGSFSSPTFGNTPKMLVKAAHSSVHILPWLICLVSETSPSEPRTGSVQYAPIFLETSCGQLCVTILACSGLRTIHWLCFKTVFPACWGQSPEGLMQKSDLWSAVSSA
mmetsp:Transcript_35466/g.101265  ORF Transcript_35466/g.101265 Transcript_35466/m.101265 type:complete len:212 (-) Transcript_35466:401-1036(-)